MSKRETFYTIVDKDDRNVILTTTVNTEGVGVPAMAFVGPDQDPEEFASVFSYIENMVTRKAVLVLEGEPGWEAAVNEEV